MTGLSGVPEILLDHIGTLAGILVFAAIGAFWTGVFGDPKYQRNGQEHLPL